MSTGLKIKTCGREPSCDLVLGHPTVSRHHASIQLGEDGLVSITDNASRNGLFLHRADRWIRVARLTLCIGDRVRFGALEVSPAEITGVFGHRSKARLEATHFKPAGLNTSSKPQESEPGLNKPRRNPVTGKIESDLAR